MHRGHAVSEDLARWRCLPVALYPDAIGTVFSGSVVVDWRNTAGFQAGEKKPLVAVFTHDKPDGQVQSLAYSNDRGRTWTKYAGNPVLERPEYRDFRDPKVFWHPARACWLMVLAAGGKAQFYSSPDLDPLAV